jgi:hypothetical protein
VTGESEILVSLAHCDLRHAAHPLAVGHYRRDVIVSAERKLDRALDGALRRRFDLGVYPGELDSSLIIRHRGRPRGAIVVGLGEVGELTAEQLRTTFATALRCYALEIAEDSTVPARDGFRSAAFSTLLVGTDGNGVGTFTDSIYAIVRAALDANRSLADRNLFDAVRIDRIEFVELYEDVAIRAAHVIADLPGALGRELKPNETVTGAQEIRTGPGGQSVRPGSPYDNGWWQRVAVRRQVPEPQQAKSDTAVQLKFTVLTDRARLEQDVATGQRALVQQLLSSATTRDTFDERLCGTLFQLLVPEGVKDRISQGGSLLFMVDGAGAGYPYELMATRDADGKIRPLVESRGILRQLETEQFDSQSEMARRDQIFLVGNPRTLLWPDLPGAAAEVEAVKKVAEKHGLSPVHPPRDDAERIITMLMTEEYRILHIAAHGQYDPDPLKSGVVISDRMFVTPAEIRNLPFVPELVFLNCCYLGKIDETRPTSPDPRLASSLAEGFIRAGVRAVVAAGWAVNDEAGRTFATTFYDVFLGGATFGESVRSARAAVMKDHGETNTWGAYQCYGNPDYRFSQQPEARWAREPPRMVSRSEALAALRALRERVRSMEDGSDEASLREEFEALRKKINPVWLKGGDILSACGEIAGELNDFDRAIEFYRLALAAELAPDQFGTVEQCANLLARAAAARAFAKNAADPGVSIAFAEAERSLAWLERFGKTRERNALRGSLLKRMAIVYPDKRKQLLRRAWQAYGFDAKDAPYQSLNAIALKFADARGGLLKTLRAAVDQQWGEAQKRVGAPIESFWDAVAEPDARLHWLVLHGKLDSTALADVQGLYAHARLAGPSPREWASVRDQLWFLWTVTGDERLRCYNKDVSAALKTLHESLGS